MHTPLYTKVSHFYRLTTPPNLWFCLSSSKREQLTCPQVVKHAVFMYKGVCIKIYWLHDEKDEAMCTYHLFSQNMQPDKEENKMWTIQLDEVNHKTNIKESSSNHSLTATVSLKHKCLSYSLITTNRRSNLCISSHAIKSEMYKQNQKDFLRLVVRLWLQKFIGFSRIQRFRF